MPEHLNRATEEILGEYQRKADAMKKAVLNAPDPAPESFPGKCYYFSSEGDDANDGLSPERPLRSCSMVERLPLQRGDAVLFRRGDLFRGGINCGKDGITFSAWGEGPKPVICGSARNYADPGLWKESSVPGVWQCTLPLKNAGIISFDHDPREIGNYDALLGFSVPWAPEMEACPRHLKNDLDFCSDLDTDILYLRSDGNPGERFKRIEIGEQVHLFCFRGGILEDLHVDNLHLTMTGAHAVSFLTHKRGKVSNCVIDYVGGSVLWRSSPHAPGRKNVRYGNAVEVYGGCSGFKVRNNWIYQIYDTGITHQFHWDKEASVLQEDVEYSGNLIEYCFWFIEYYNTECKYNVTRNIHVHGNFCRFAAAGWGCTPERKNKSPMCRFIRRADVTENYVTENNIFETAGGFIYNHTPPLEPEGSLIFRGNTYIQRAGGNFAEWGGELIPFTEEAVTHFLNDTLHEKGYTLLAAE